MNDVLKNILGLLKDFREDKDAKDLFERLVVIEEYIIAVNSAIQANLGK